MTKLNCKQKTIHQKHHQARKQQNALAELLPRNPINERGLNHIINICRIIYIISRIISVVCRIIYPKIASNKREAMYCKIALGVKEPKELANALNGAKKQVKTQPINFDIRSQIS